MADRFSFFAVAAMPPRWFGLRIGGNSVIGRLLPNKVRARLYVAFGCATALTIAAGLVALRGFTSVEKEFQSAVGRSVPTMETALELARNSALLSAAAPALARAQASDKSAAIMADLQERLDQIRGLIDVLKSEDETATETETLNTLVSSFEAYLETLAAEVEAGLNANARLDEVSKQVVQTHEQILAKIKPVLAQAEAEVGKGSASLSIGGV